MLRKKIWAALHALHILRFFYSCASRKRYLIDSCFSLGNFLRCDKPILIRLRSAEDSALNKLQRLSSFLRSSGANRSHFSYSSWKKILSSGMALANLKAPASSFCCWSGLKKCQTLWYSIKTSFCDSVRWPQGTECETEETPINKHQRRKRLMDQPIQQEPWWRD